MRKLAIIVVTVAAMLVAGTAAAAPSPSRLAGLGPALLALIRNDDALLDRPGIAAAGVGRDSGGRAVIRVYLENAATAVPATIGGVPVVAHVSGRWVARSDPRARFSRPTPIGVSIGHPQVTAGTLGARVRDAAGNVYILSNNHILANQNDALVGDPILQPGAYDGGIDPADVIGTLADFQAISYTSGTTNTMDAAIASTTAAQVGVATPSDDGYGAPSSTLVPPSVGLQVKKYGRTTGLTLGQIEALGVTADVCYESDIFGCIRSARFVNQISITPGGFSTGGDSGSLIVTQLGNNPVALLFAGSSTRTLANPLEPVLTRFGVTVDNGSATGNIAPSVQAGPDLQLTLPNGSVLLDGTVSDDGQPDATPLVAWSQQSGPGTVVFANANAVDTTATFAQAGTYVLRLAADDGELTSVDTVAVTVYPEPGPIRMYLAFETQTQAGSVLAANEDVLAFDGSGFARVFDGSDVGVGGFAIDAFSVEASGSLLLSFTAAGTVPGVGSVDDSDVVRFTPTSLGEATSGTFTLFFDASDVGLSTADEDVDAFELLPDGRLVVSTFGAFSVSGGGGADEDLIVLTPTSLGTTTAGTWAMYLDGSDVGLGGTNEDIDGVAVDAAGSLHLTTAAGFAVTGLSGADEDVAVFVPTSLGPASAGAWSPSLEFDGSAFGLAASDVVAIDLP